MLTSLKPIIAVDIDDVLALNAKGFMEWSNQQFGTSLTAENYDEDSSLFWKIDPIETERRFKLFHDSDAVAFYEPIKEGVAVLKRLHKRYEQVAVTSRRVSSAKHTHNWLSKYCAGLFDEVYFSGIYDQLAEGNHLRTKADLFEQLKPDYVIDDQLKHCQAGVQAGAQVVLFGDYPWNRTGELSAGITRCKDWAAVEEYFDGR